MLLPCVAPQVGISLGRCGAHAQRIALLRALVPDATTQVSGGPSPWVCGRLGGQKQFFAWAPWRGQWGAALPSLSEARPLQDGLGEVEVLDGQACQRMLAECGKVPPKAQRQIWNIAVGGRGLFYSALPLAESFHSTLPRLPALAQSIVK